MDAAYKAYEISHFVGLKKSHCYSLRFLRKAPTKNDTEAKCRKKTSKMSHSAENSEKRDPLGLFNIRSLAKYQKIERTLWGHL